MGWSWNPPYDRQIVLTGKDLLMYDDVFHFPSNNPPLSDFSVLDVPLLEEMHLNCFYSPSELVVPEDLLSDSLRVWNEINNQNLLSCYDNSTNNEKMGSKKLSWETIKKYFYVPITQAARELNVGLTLLKKRCRELGIRRWPHRKLASIQTLIDNVKKLGDVDGAVKENLLRMLEEEKRLLEEMPDIQLDATTKRLRQAYFKASYKKRKLMGAVGSTYKRRATDTDTVVAIADHGNVGGEEEEEYLKYLIADCSSF